MTSLPSSSSSSSKGARTRREKPPDSTLGSLIHHDSLTYSSVSPYDQNQSHCTGTDYRVFINENKKKKTFFLKIKRYFTLTYSQAAALRSGCEQPSYIDKNMYSYFCIHTQLHVGRFWCIAQEQKNHTFNKRLQVQSRRGRDYIPFMLELLQTADILLLRAF